MVAMTAPLENHVSEPTLPLETSKADSSQENLHVDDKDRVKSLKLQIWQKLLGEWTADEGGHKGARLVVSGEGLRMNGFLVEGQGSLNMGFRSYFISDSVEKNWIVLTVEVGRDTKAGQQFDEWVSKIITVEDVRDKGVPERIDSLTWISDQRNGIIKWTRPEVAGLRWACGASHSMVVTGKQDLLAWGGNQYGQVGNGSTYDLRIAGHIIMKGVKAVAGGRGQSLAVGISGELYAWGNNDDCLLGTGTRLKQEVPQKIRDGGVAAVAAGWEHCLLLTEHGEVFAWGGNKYGQLGNGTKTAQRKPVKVIDSHVTGISAGWYHSLAVTDTGDVLTWGYSHNKSGGAQCALTPSIILRASVMTVAAGGTHSLALTYGNEVLAWGGNENGQLGDGSTTRRTVPVVVATHVISIAAGSHHSVAMDENYNVVHWGFTRRGSKGEPINQFTPTKIDIDGGVFAIAAGDAHTMVVSQSGEVWSWGSNSSGQLGDGKIQDHKHPYNTLPPATVATITMAEIIAKKMKGARDVDDEEDDDIEDMLPGKGKPRQSLRSASSKRVPHSVPQLLEKIEGTHTEVPGLGAQYPLSYNGSALTSPSLTHSGSLGFIPGTGFRPNSHHLNGKPNTMALTWGETPFSIYARRHKQQRQLASPHTPIVDPAYAEAIAGLKRSLTRQSQLSLAGTHSMSRSSTQLALPGLRSSTRSGFENTDAKQQLALMESTANESATLKIDEALVETVLQEMMDARKMDIRINSVDAKHVLDSLRPVYKKDELNKKIVFLMLAAPQGSSVCDTEHLADELRKCLLSKRIQ